MCLDFVNTVGGRDAAGAVIRDKIGGYRDLLDWSRAAGAVDAPAAGRLQRRMALHPGEAAAALDRAIRLREALYRIFPRAAAGRRAPASDVAILNQELAIARAHQHLMQRAGRLCWGFAERDTLEQILWPISLSAGELLTSKDLGRLGQCRGEECGWLFLDTSRSRRRRWCDMRDCGNRAKVKRFRARAI